MYEHIEKMMKNNPHRMIEILDELSKEYGEEILDYFKCHITTEDEYNDYVQFFQNRDGSTGAHWTLDAIKAKANINFSSKDYTLYDFAYAANMRYSDDGDLMPVDNIMISAQRYLEDEDSPVADPSTRAYEDARLRKKVFTEE